MSLKSCLQLLLSKFVKKADTDFISKQGMPDGWDRRIVIKDIALGDFQGEFIPPCAGYFCIDGGNSLAELYIGGAVHSRIELISDVGLPWPQTFVPTDKGKEISYKVRALPSQTEGTNVYFIPAIGASLN